MTTFPLFLPLSISENAWGVVESPSLISSADLNVPSARPLGMVA